MQIIPRTFYQRSTAQVAQELIGAYVIRKIDNQTVSGRIVETEAYGAHEDPASHAYRGKTKRTQPMFGIPGKAYVYFIYGNHFCFNIVAKDNTAQAGAVLIRAIEPMEGIDLMQQNRQRPLNQLTNGPGKLCHALQITKEHNFLDLTQEEQLWIATDNHAPEIISSARIGISKAQDLLWRFYEKNNQWVSR